MAYVTHLRELGSTQTDYAAALQAYQTNPSQETYDAAKAAYEADLRAWGQQASGVAAQHAASVARYNSDKAAWDRTKAAYDIEFARWQSLSQTAAALGPAWTAYQNALQAWTAKAQGAAAANASRSAACASATEAYNQARAAWQNALAQWRGQSAAYAACMAQRNLHANQLNAPIYQRWGGTMPASYPGCLADSVRDAYYTRCTGTYMRGLGTFPSGVPVETSGSWRGIPICMLAELPKCSQLRNCGTPPSSVAPQEPAQPQCQPLVVVPPKPTAPTAPPAVPARPKPPGPEPTPPAAVSPPRPRPVPPTPYEPPAPSTPITAASAGGGFGASGLLLVLVLAGGGYVGYRLMTRKKGAR